MQRIVNVCEEERVDCIFSELSRLNPEPQVELNYTNEYTFLVAVILSAQTTDKMVNRVTGALFDRVSSPSEMCSLGQETLESYISKIGLYRNKAKNVLRMSSALLEKHGGVVPGEYHALVSLPGVGRKTANVVLNAMFSKKCIAVDRHVYRVSKRIGLASSDSMLGVEKDLEACIGDKWIMNAHKWIVLHGRYTCTARKPRCDECTIRNFCNFFCSSY